MSEHHHHHQKNRKVESWDLEDESVPVIEEDIEREIEHFLKAGEWEDEENQISLTHSDSQTLNTSDINDSIKEDPTHGVRGRASKPAITVDSHPLNYEGHEKYWNELRRRASGKETVIFTSIFSTCEKFYIAGSTSGSINIWDTSFWNQSPLSIKLVDEPLVSLRFMNKDTLVSSTRSAFGGSVSFFGWKNLHESSTVIPRWELTNSTLDKNNIGFACLDVACSKLESQKLYLGASNSRIYVVDVENQMVTNIVSGHRAAINSVRERANHQQLITASDDGTVMFWDLRSMKEVQTLHPNRHFESSVPQEITALALDPQENWLLVGGASGCGVLYYLPAMEPTAFLPTSSALSDVIWDGSQSRFVSAGCDKHVSFWDLSGKLHARIPVSLPTVFSLASSPSVGLAAAGMGQDVFFFPKTSPQPISTKFVPPI